MRIAENGIKTQKQLIAELLNDINKSLIMDKVNLGYVERRSSDLGNKGFEYQKTKSEIEMTINSRLGQLDILKEMYYEIAFPDKKE